MSQALFRSKLYRKGIISYYEEMEQNKVYFIADENLTEESLVLMELEIGRIFKNLDYTPPKILMFNKEVIKKC